MNMQELCIYGQYNIISTVYPENLAVSKFGDFASNQEIKNIGEILICDSTYGWHSAHAS